MNDLHIAPGVIRWGNLPVPFVASWTSENALRIAPDPLWERRPGEARGAA